jgi:hypothetical protein
MKRLFYGLIVIAFVTQTVEAQKKSDREIDGLMGSVSAVHRYLAEIQNKDGSGGEGEKAHSWDTHYERDGKNLKKTEYPWHLTCFHHVKMEITNNEKGNRIMTLPLTDHHTKTYSGKWVYIYDSNDRVIEHLFYDKADEIRSKMVLTYNESGTEKEIAYFDGKGILEQTLTFTYKEFDSTGNWIKRVAINQKLKSGYDSQWAEYRTITYYP